MTFRPYERGDLERCLELYLLNEPDRFPEQCIGHFEKALGSSYFLIGEKEARIVCTGGINHFWNPQNSVLCFGLVDPKHQGQGIGTALTLARLSLLNPEFLQHMVFIFALEKSIGFYQRMGFRSIEPWQDKTGKHHPSGGLIFSREQIFRARNLLTQSGILVPEPPVSIPLVEPERAQQDAANAPLEEKDSAI